MIDLAHLLEEFRARFGSPGSVCRAPGRVNLIGEHTDYNDGLVLPAAIEFYCWVVAGPRNDRKLVIHSQNFKETIEADLDQLGVSVQKHWSDYPLGVAWALEAAGKRLRGANLLISGDVPLGAGLSSSAAIEVATGLALVESSGVTMDRTDLARVCQQAENEYVGARVGIMDQFVACHGRASHALLIDCRSLEHGLVKLPPGIQLVICNTMVKHEIASGEYNRRRSECEEGVSKLRGALAEVRSLRDVTLAQLEKHRDLLNAKVFARCRHVVTENERVKLAVQAFEQDDIKAMGPLMRDSHNSLRDDYEVSSEELDAMVQIASAQPGVAGARMTGGGFGGCTINLVETAAVDPFRKNVAREYCARTGRTPEIFVSAAADGAHPMDAGEREFSN